MKTGVSRTHDSTRQRQRVFMTGIATRSASRDRRKNTHGLPFFENPIGARSAVAGRLLAVDENHLGEALGNLESFDQIIEARTVVDLDLTTATRALGKAIAEIRK
jgi:hypothetical protein